MRADSLKALLLFPLGLGGSGLGGLCFGHALLEFINTAGGIDELLLAGEERMADVADADQNDRLGGAGLNHVAASATDFRFLIFRMNFSFHKRRKNLAAEANLTSLFAKIFAKKLL